jgi:chaperonin cofactor prefoldin
MAQRLSPTVEQEYERYRKMLEEHENWLATARLWEAQIGELTRTLEELSKQPEDVVTYKSVGQVVMFKVEKPKIVEEMTIEKADKERSLVVLKKKLETQATKIKELHDKLQVELGKQNLKLQ